MFSNILTKSLFERRWTILWWFLATLVSVFGIMLIFPPIRDAMGSMFANVPTGMEGWFGTSSTWQTLSGFAGQEVFGQMSNLLVVAAIVFGAAFLAGEENSGQLTSLLAQPVRRISVYTQKFLALAIMMLIISVGFYGGIILGGVALGESIDYARFFDGTLMVFLLSLSLGALTYAVGAITGRKGVAGLVVGFYAFIGYFVASLAGMADIVEKISYGALYRYVDGSGVMTSGLDLKNIVIFVIVIVIAFLIGLIVFRRRDITSR